MPYRRTESRIRHTEAVKNRILDCAVEIIATDGLSGLTVRKTINLASTSNGNFYFHFKDKTDLIHQVVRRGLELVGADIDRAGRMARDRHMPIPSILASMVYAGIRIGLAECRKPGILLQPSLRTKTYEVLKPYMIDRTTAVLSALPSLPTGLNPGLAATLWQGSLLTVVNECSGSESDDELTAAQCAAWNLRAIGASVQEIDRAIKDAEQIWGALARSGLS